MPNFTVQITVMPLTNLLDPQGKAVHDSLHKLGLQAIDDIRIGKNIVLQITADNAEQAHKIADEACKKMLYNAVMEQYQITVI
jgi:phosphoribosylformylglycinamidine synthase subunit PurS